MGGLTWNKEHIDFVINKREFGIKPLEIKKMLEEEFNIERTVRSITHKITKHAKGTRKTWSAEKMEVFESLFFSDETYNTTVISEKLTELGFPCNQSTVSRFINSNNYIRGVDREINNKKEEIISLIIDSRENKYMKYSDISKLIKNKFQVDIKSNKISSMYRSETGEKKGLFVKVPKPVKIKKTKIKKNKVKVKKTKIKEIKEIKVRGKNLQIEIEKINKLCRAGISVTRIARDHIHCCEHRLKKFLVKNNIYHLTGVNKRSNNTISERKKPKVAILNDSGEFLHLSGEFFTKDRNLAWRGSEGQLAPMSERIKEKIGRVEIKFIELRL